VGTIITLGDGPCHNRTRIHGLEKIMAAPN